MQIIDGEMIYLLSKNQNVKNVNIIHNSVII